MIFVQKLPTLEPEMRDALRCHIMRKRQRLKQEMEQDAIEKRLKREKEMKQLQDAMTLDQIKEQLANLEKRLESLKDEKHHLFNQLKQVLNEDSARRKQNDAGSKRSSTEETQPQSNAADQTSTSNPSSSHSNLSSKAEELNPKQLPTAIKLETSRFNTTNLSAEATNFSHPPPVERSPQPAIHPNYPIPVSMARPIFSNKLLTEETHSTFRVPVANPTPELIAPHPLNFSQHGILQHPNNRPLLLDAPVGIMNHLDTKILATSGKRSSSVANMNEDQFVERSLARKKPNYVYPNSHQFLISGIPHDIPHSMPSMSQYNPISQHGSLQPPLTLPVPSSSPSFIPNNLNPRKPLTPHHLSSLDYIALMNQGKPGMVLPNLVHPQYYGHPTPLMQHNSLYPITDSLHQDLNHFNPSYASLVPQYSNPGRASIPHPTQPDLSSQYLPLNNHQRKQSHTKNPYYHNK